VIVPGTLAVVAVALPFDRSTVNENEPFVPVGVPAVPATAAVKPPPIVISAEVTVTPVEPALRRVLICVTNHVVTSVAVLAVA
jgi:hypothetical protein